MKKFLSLGLLVAALAIVVGCEEKKSTPGTPTKVNTQGVLDTKTVRVTTTVKGDGPAVPPAGGKNDKDGK